jgi:carbon-monoxide dehydrogenase medium subunit
MKRFELFEPVSLEEATRLLNQIGEKCSILAGGTDLLLRLKREEIEPDFLVSLRRIAGLSFIQKEDGFVKLGAFTTHRTIEKSPMIRTSFGALSDAVDNLGSIQIRNIATIGGNICNAAPSADTVPPLMVHDAQLKIFGPNGERELPLEVFFEAPGRTKLIAGEILTETTLSTPPLLTSSAYIKLTRRSSMELPLLGVAAQISFSQEGTISDGRIALSCAGPTCFRAKGAEALLRGNKLEKEFLEEVGLEVLKESKPRDSFRCSAQYRRAMIPILVARSLTQCYKRCFKEEVRKR